MKLKTVCIGILLVMGITHSHAQTGQPLKDAADSVFTKAEHPAEFPGGANGWRLYLEQNLQYPKKALKKNIQGVAQVSFVVDKDGEVLDVKIVTDPGGGLGEEAARMIRTGPKWMPAEQSGKKVKYRHIQSITFQLQ